mgnify:CR=1 FL=1
MVSGRDRWVARDPQLVGQPESGTRAASYCKSRDRLPLSGLCATGVRRDWEGSPVASPKGIVVQKYGGSSVADADGIKRVAQRIVATKRDGYDVVVVVSAMGDTTDELIDLAEQVSPLPSPRELDMLLTAGERISMALLAMGIGNLGYDARSFTGSQAGVITTEEHGRAKIMKVTPGRVLEAVEEGAIAIVAGFQGVSQTTKNITTLGRGGSDTTAVALAAALNAQVCEIYSDVDGVFTADPRIVPTARKINRLAYEEMLEMAACGAKILHLRCVEYARRYHMPIHVRSSFSKHEGTWISGSIDDQPEDPTMEQAIISGVAHDRSEAKITVVGVPDKVGEAAAVFTALAGAHRATQGILGRLDEVHLRVGAELLRRELGGVDLQVLSHASRQRLRSPGEDLGVGPIREVPEDWHEAMHAIAQPLEHAAAAAARRLGQRVR